MENNKGGNQPFDLEERTLNFAKRIVRMCKALPNSSVNYKLIDQIIRSAGSVGANYREANDALGKKDFLMRMKIARKETKETQFWLELIIEANPELKERIKELLNESIELKKIFSAIITKSQK
ncbi:MAG: four helix bundle protein [Candidatus Falkowbacteria bacterium]|nr:four helix bundle protein [Candidatus Falkowbacteria bacterium]